MTEYISDKQMVQELEKRDVLLRTLNNAANILLQTESGSFDDDLINCIGMIGKAVDADRVDIWQNHLENGRLFCALIYAWSRDVAEPQVFKEIMVDASYDDDIPGWKEILSRGDCVVGLVCDLPPRIQAQLSLLGTLSIVVVPVFVQDKFWGYVGYNNCHEERLFTDNEQVILRSGSLMIANAFVHNVINQSIRDSAARFEAVVENHPGIIWCADDKGALSLFNGLFLKKNGFPRDYFNGKTIADIPESLWPPEVANHIYKTFAEGEQEWVQKTKSGTFHMRTSPIYGSGGTITSVVGSMDEITEFVRLQEELEYALDKASAANRAKSNFLARMSHEIRTPMNAIIGMVELTLREDIPDMARENILMVKQASANLLSIINDILDFSKIEAGRLKIFLNAYLLASLLNDVISIIRMRMVDEPIHFVVNVDSNIPNALIGDELRLRQIMINLLGNAVKYTEKGFVSFVIKSERVDDETVNLAIIVKDTGKGIRPNEIGKLFAEYAQVDVESNKDIEGTGLGLAITSSLVKAMNGEIKADSEYGAGSTFTARIPQKIHNREILASVIEPETKRVLVYEQREAYADSFARTITDLGVPCVLVANDAAFIEKLETASFAFIFITYALYDRNRALIRTHAPEAVIVLLTEFGESIPEKDVNTLAMPAHCISIANVLNGSSDNFKYSESNEHVAQFTAPLAKILIVDDISINLIVAEGLLAPYKMQLVLCKGGAEAIREVRSKDFDLVFMDHRMPGMDGVEATRLIRAMGKADAYFENLPIIALTANAILGIKEMFLKNGLNDYITKPIDTVMLDIMLEKWIPKDKQKRMTAKDRPRHLEPQILFNIKGLDTKIGLAMTRGKSSLYINVLEAFCNDGPEVVKNLKQCVETGNYPLYTTYMHGIKSAAANVGAVELLKLAESLEKAGKNEDTAFIQDYNEAFISELTVLVGYVDKFLTAYRKDRAAASDGINGELFKTELLSLKKSIDDLNAGAINRAMENLQTLPVTERSASVVRNISKNILMAEYEIAAELIDALLRQALAEQDDPVHL